MWPSQRRLRQLQPALRLLLALPIAALLLHTDTPLASAASGSGSGMHRTRDDIINDLSWDFSNKINGDYTKRPMRIVLAGTDDPEKTAFCRFLRLSLRSSNMDFPAQTSVDLLHEKAPSTSDTKNVTKYTETLFGGGSIEIYDTPDFFDVEDAPRDMERMNEIQERLKSLDYVDVVLFYFGSSFYRRRYFRKEYVLAQLSAVFPRSVYENIALVQHYYRNSYDEYDLDMRAAVNSEFSFSEEAVKSRRFDFRNSLEKAIIWNLYQQGQTIKSLFRDSFFFIRYEKDMKDLTRLFEYFFSNPRVGRCNNPGFSAMSTSLSRVRIPSACRKQPNAREIARAHAECLSSLRSRLESLPIDYTKYLRVIRSYLSSHIASKRWKVDPSFNQRFPLVFDNIQRDHLTRNLKILEHRLEVVQSELETLASLSANSPSDHQKKDHQNSQEWSPIYSVCAGLLILYIVVYSRHCSLATRFEALLRSDRRFMIVSKCRDLVYFRLICENLDDGNKLNQHLIDAINSQGDVFLLQSKIGSRVVIRFELFSPLASLKDVEAAFRSIQASTTAFLRSRRM